MQKRIKESLQGEFINSTGLAHTTPCFSLPTSGQRGWGWQRWDQVTTLDGTCSPGRPVLEAALFRPFQFHPRVTVAHIRGGVAETIQGHRILDCLDVGH